MLDPGDDDLLVEIATQLEEIVVRVPLIDLDQSTCTRARLKAVREPELPGACRSGVRGLCGTLLSFRRSPPASPMRLPSSPVASLFFESAC